MVRRFRFAALALLAASCSLLVTFDDESQPCDRLGNCYGDFSCVDHLCKRVDGGVPVPDAGGADAGHADGGG